MNDKTNELYLKYQIIKAFDKGKKVIVKGADGIELGIKKYSNKHVVGCHVDKQLKREWPHKWIIEWGDVKSFRIEEIKEKK